MVKKIFLMFLVVFSFLLVGCETSKGMAKGAEGIAAGIGSTVEGAGKDTVGLWQAIMKADQWFKDNLW